MRRAIFTDGSTADFDQPRSIREIANLIGAANCDTVTLKHMGNPVHVMVIDDNGLNDGRPVNAEATRLYHLNCRPGTTAQIHGDVFITPDEDFA